VIASTIGVAFACPGKDTVILFPARRTELIDGMRATLPQLGGRDPKTHKQVPKEWPCHPVAVQYLQTRRVVAALMHVVACPCVPKTSTLGGRCGTASGRCCCSQQRCLPRARLNALRSTTLSNRSACIAGPTGEQRRVGVGLWQ
jgi:hypothetical protein